jgi:hypothetical protein
MAVAASITFQYIMESTSLNNCIGSTFWKTKVWPLCVKLYATSLHQFIFCFGLAALMVSHGFVCKTLAWRSAVQHGPGKWNLYWKLLIFIHDECILRYYTTWPSKNRCFSGTYRLHLQGNETLESSQLAVRICLMMVGKDSLLHDTSADSRVSILWGWRWYVPPKRRFLLKPHSLISHCYSRENIPEDSVLCAGQSRNVRQNNSLSTITPW